MSGPVSILISAIGWIILHQCWQALLISGGMRIGHRWLAKSSPHARHLFSLLCFTLLVCSTTYTAVYFLGVQTFNRETAGQAASSTVLDTIFGRSGLVADFDGGLRYRPISTISWPDRVATTVAPWLPVVVATWAIGAAIYSGREVRRTLRLRAALQLADPVDDALLDRLKNLSASMRLPGRVDFLETQRFATPMVTGLFRPSVLLPIPIISVLSPQEVEAVAAHELAHVRRLDAIVNLFQTVFDNLFFYHPSVLRISRQLTIDREYSCDNDAGRVCGDFPLYARMLAKVSDLAAEAPPHTLALASGSLQERVTMVDLYRRAPKITGRVVIGALIACTGVATLAGATIIGQVSDFRERRDTARLPIDQFYDRVFGATSPAPAFKAAYVAALRETKRATPDDAVLAALVDAAVAGPDLNLVWRQYLPLITPTTYPIIKREFPKNWEFEEASTHRRLVARLWRYAASLPTGEGRRRAARSAIAIACMRREQGTYAALRQIVTDPAFLETSGLDRNTARSLCIYWVDANEQTGEAINAAITLQHASPDGGASAVSTVARNAEQVPEAAFVATYFSNSLGGRTATAVKAAAAQSQVMRHAAAPSQVRPKVPPLIVTMLIRQLVLP